MKNIILLIFMIFAVHGISNADSSDKLSDSIMKVCDPNNTVTEVDEMEDCMLYYVNCVVGPGGKWDDEDLFRCMKERIKEN